MTRQVILSNHKTTLAMAVQELKLNFYLKNSSNTFLPRTFYLHFIMMRLFAKQTHLTFTAVVKSAFHAHPRTHVHTHTHVHAHPHAPTPSSSSQHLLKITACIKVFDLENDRNQIKVSIQESKNT